MTLKIPIEEKREKVRGIESRAKSLQNAGMSQSDALKKACDEAGLGEANFYYYRREVENWLPEENKSEAVSIKKSRRLTITVNPVDLRILERVANVYCFNVEHAAQMLLHDGIVHCLGDRDDMEASN